MKNLKYIFIVFVLFAGISFTNAENKEVFPIADLGNCKDQKSCKTFCDQPDNILACVSYAENNGMMSKEQAEMAKEYADVLKGEGPGQCKTQDSCKSYCDATDHLDECLSFAEKHNLINKDDLKQARKVSEALKKGAKLPGGCTTKDSCESFCSNADNAEECLGFAEVAGFISKEEAELAHKVLPLIKAGQSPKGCKTKDECEKVCGDEENILTCVEFAEKAGFMSKEDADMVRKTGGKGPNGCKSKDECEKFCDDEANQEVCLNFAKEHDLIPADKLEAMNAGLKQMEEGLNQAPPEIRDCIKEKLGPDFMAKGRAGKLNQGDIQGLVMECMKDFKPAGIPDVSQMGPGNIPGFSGGDSNNAGDESESGDDSRPSSAPSIGANCSLFASVPSCSYVPENVRDMCEKCKNQ